MGFGLIKQNANLTIPNKASQHAEILVLYANTAGEDRTVDH